MPSIADQLEAQFKDGTITPEGAALADELRRMGEWAVCKIDPIHFISKYCKITTVAADGVSSWSDFIPWPAQEDFLNVLGTKNRVVALKARQLGFTWIVLAHTLHKMVFYPIATWLLFSKTDREALAMIERLSEMIKRLPDNIRPLITSQAAHEITFDNGSKVTALPTTAGQSYTATGAVIDEADKISSEKKSTGDKLKVVLDAVKPTVDANGQLIVLSTPDKSRPDSLFKRIYMAATRNHNGYTPVFYGWNARPERTREWYEAERKADFENTGSYDHCHQEYAETQEQALSARELDKRLAPKWLESCFQNCVTLYPVQAPSIPQLTIYVTPKEGQTFVAGLDPAEGRKKSHESAMTVLNEETGEEVATLAGRIEPSIFAEYADQIGRYYNGAKLLIERNNHGHTVILALKNLGTGLTLLRDPRDKHEGWREDERGKVLIYNYTADAFRLGDTRIHSLETFRQLGSIEISTLKAPDGMADDRAMGYALACAARVESKKANWIESDAPEADVRGLITQIPKDVFGTTGKMEG